MSLDPVLRSAAPPPAPPEVHRVAWRIQGAAGALQVVPCVQKLRPVLYRETDGAAEPDEIKDGDLVVVSYAMAMRDVERLEKVKRGTLVLDEAQFVKNSQTKTAFERTTERLREFELRRAYADEQGKLQSHLEEQLSSAFEGTEATITKSVGDPPGGRVPAPGSGRIDFPLRRVTLNGAWTGVSSIVAPRGSSSRRWESRRSSSPAATAWRA